MKKPKWYFCELWRMNYYFYVGWKFSDFCSYIKKEYSYQVDEKPVPVGKCLMLTSDAGKCVIHIWIEKKTDYPSLAHECLHAANYTLDRAGWFYHPDNHEPQTYLMTNLMRQALGKGMKK